MSKEVFDISQFRRNSSFYGQIPLLLTIKNFDLAAIRARYIKSRDNVSGRTGSVERRKAGEGGLASLTIAEGEVKEVEILVKMKEPRGIDVKEGDFTFSSEAHVYVVSDDDVKVINEEWFSYIHTVNFSPWDDRKILVSSSGYDCIFEFDLQSGLKSFEWFAWEHGFSRGINSVNGKAFQLTRNKDQADRYASDDVDYLLIDNPSGASLPTANRAAFINSVYYHEEDESQILATFFHEGKVYSIDRKSGMAVERIGALSKPHGGRNYGGEYLVTSTGSGEIFIGLKDKLKIYSLANLNGKPEELGDMEWVQNTLATNDLLIAIDSNRTSFVIIDPVEKLYDMVPYDENWAVQDAVVGELNEGKKNLIRNLG